MGLCLSRRRVAVLPNWWATEISNVLRESCLSPQVLCFPNLMKGEDEGGVRLSRSPFPEMGPEVRAPFQLGPVPWFLSNLFPLAIAHSTYHQLGPGSSGCLPSHSGDLAPRDGGALPIMIIPGRSCRNPTISEKLSSSSSFRRSHPLSPHNHHGR